MYMPIMCSVYTVAGNLFTTALQISPLIHEPASAHVHHMLLYSCDGSGVDSFTDEQLRGSECLTGSGGQGDIKLRCLGGNLVGAWAVGGTVSGIS